MNRDQKALAIAEIADHIDRSEAVFAVDYRGITVAQVAELRVKLRDADATFKVVKNSLTERAADQVGAESLKEHLAGPTALTFVRGDVALAAKAVADYARVTQLLPFKGGLMSGEAIDVEQLRSLSRLPSRDVLYGQLVGVVASPVSGLVRTLNALVSGLAVALGQVREKKQSGEIPAAAPAAGADISSPGDTDPATDGAGDGPEAPTASATEAEQTEPAAEQTEPAGEQTEPAAERTEPEAPEQAAVQAEPEQAEPEPSRREDSQDGPAQVDDNEADATAEAQPEDAEANPTKED